MEEEENKCQVLNRGDSQGARQLVKVKVKRAKGLYSRPGIDELQRRRLVACYLGRRGRGRWDLLVKKRSIRQGGGM